jgi:hypothetical protein
LNLGAERLSRPVKGVRRRLVTSNNHSRGGEISEVLPENQFSVLDYFI